MSNFHSSFSTATKNCLIPSSVSSSLEGCAGGRYEGCEGGRYVCKGVDIRCEERENLPFD